MRFCKIRHIRTYRHIFLQSGGLAHPSDNGVSNVDQGKIPINSLRNHINIGTPIKITKKITRFILFLQY